MTPFKNMDTVTKYMGLLTKLGFTTKFEYNKILVYKAALDKYKNTSDWAYYNSFTTVEEFLVFANFILDTVCNENPQKIEMLQEMYNKKIDRWKD